MAKKSRGVSTKQHPFRGFLDVMSETSRARSQWLMGTGSQSSQGARSHAEAYVPPADIFANGPDLFIRCEVPGARRDEISATVSGGILTIAGHRDSELDENNVVYYSRERVYGEFRRTMILPEGIDQNDISVTISNGLLEIQVHDGAAGKPHQLTIVDQDED